jgi:hypothetical protein
MLFNYQMRNKFVTVEHGNLDKSMEILTKAWKS